MEEKGRCPMRILGMILVIIGALALGCQEFLSSKREAGWNVAIPPVMGGISVTSGLILITSALKVPGAAPPRRGLRGGGEELNTSYPTTAGYGVGG